MSRAFTSVALLALFATPAFATETYVFDKSHTNIVWHANHLGFSNPSGKWMDVDGELMFDQAHPETSKIEAIINVAHVITGIEKFDTHLESEDFFNVAKYPTAKFVSTKIVKTGENTGDVTGDLTLLGKTQPVTLHVIFNKQGVNPMSNAKTVGFSAETTLKRSEWGMEYGLPHVSDEVPIHIEAELTAKE